MTALRVGAVLLIFMITAVLTYAWLRLVDLLMPSHGPEPYSPEFAGHCDDALDIARSVPFVDSNHPTDCDEECCFEIRLTEKTDAFPWDAYEQELTK